MATAFDAQFLPEDPRRRRGDAAASRLWRPSKSFAGLNALQAETIRRHQGATKIGVIRHHGIARHNRSDCRISPHLPVRWAA
jgi:hypothetical protein